MSSKLREALSEIIDLINKWRTDGEMEHWQYSQLFDIADAALAEPLRNCDVGTAEEQEARYTEYCVKRYIEERKKTLSYYIPKKYRKSQFEWAQMPYEKEGGE